tara:strand:+ start:77 stop:1192 length:1116 start_codon:yes stop_codon:yes gene_type:complete
MKNSPVIAFVIGTRPEAIKLAPVIKIFKECKSINTIVLLTGQHKELVDEVNKSFEIKEDFNLNLMKEVQSLTHITCAALEGLRNFIIKNPINLLVVQGDTTSAFSACLAAFYENIPVAHIEAGLRTDNLNDPFPEELNRRLISQMAKIHFAPTKKAVNNLNQSGVFENVFLTGNTVIDALLFMTKRKKKSIFYDQIKGNKVIFVTVHRRENWGRKLENIVEGLNRILNKYKNVKIILPMHPNKVVRKPILDILGSNSRAILAEPLAYDELIATINECDFILTDSGGIQEEAPSLNKPVLILRDTTERQEAIAFGTAKLIGTDPKVILTESENLLFDNNKYNSMANSSNPFGDGKASERILKYCLEFLKISN